MKKKAFVITSLVLLFTAMGGFAQTSDTRYAMNLEDVLLEAQQRYGIQIKYSAKDVEGKVLDYALWRFRPDVEKTLDNILTPFDFYAQKQSDSVYKVQQYRYHVLSVEEGKEKLDYLSGLYSDRESWEARASELRNCIDDVLGLDRLPPSPGTKPIVGKIRKMDGYTVQNVALETLPGLYLCGSVYRPAKYKGKLPVILCPNGHGSTGRYHPDMQRRCAALARMGAMVVNYDKFAYGESLLQFEPRDHSTSMAMRIQAMNSRKMLDYMLSLPEADPNNVGMTGASGGGSETMLTSAMDPRVTVSVPVVMMSVIHSGGCPCESGLPVHLCGDGTTNVEIAAMFAPKPQLIITDGGDWTANVPWLEFPHVQRIYGFYGAEGDVLNAHFPDGHHDYIFEKRVPMYGFMADHLGLDIKKIQNKEGEIVEYFVTIEDPEAMKVFGKDGEYLPENAIRSFEELEKLLEK